MKGRKSFVAGGLQPAGVSAIRRAKARRLLRFAVALLPLTLLAQQPPRDGRVAPVGTSEIAGVVMTAEEQPRPMRRVVVNLSGDALPDSRSVITDDAGRFAFAKLPAGSYAVVAKKAAYLEAAFGSPQPGRPGSRIALTAGEKRAIRLTMFRGAAVGGILRNPNGSPLAGVNVTLLDARTLGRDQPPGETAITNDRGEYRIYGVTPGEYLVVAVPRAGGSGEIGARSAADTDALIAALKQRQSGASPSAAVPRAPIPDPPAVGYSPIYFPGTPLFTQAERVRLSSGDDRPVSFEVPRVPVASIEGTVSGDIPSPVGIQLAIVPEVSRLLFGGPGAGVPFTAVPPNELGEFKFGNLAPGNYQIVARARRGPPVVAPPPPGGGGGGRMGGGGALSGPGSGDMLYAVATVEIRGQDVKGLHLSLEPGGTLFGKLVFDSGGTPAPADLSRFRVGLTVAGETSYYQLGGVRIGNVLSEVQAAFINPDGTFQITGVGPSPYTLTCTVPNDLAPVWKLRSAIFEGRELLDTIVKGPSVQMRGVTVTLSDKRTEIAGSLQSGTGQPATDYYVIAFSTDRADWRFNSRRSMSTRPATNGRYVFSDLPAGEYFIAALTDLDPFEWYDAAFLEQVVPAAIKVRIAEGEKKTQDLRIK